MQRRSLLVLSTVLITSVAVSSPAAATGEPGPQQQVIVLMHDQHENIAATQRRTLNEADQQPLVDRARLAGAENIKQFTVVNGFAAAMTADAQDRLAADPRVRAIVPDRVITKPVRPVATKAATDQRVCLADPARPQLEPEALQLTHTAFEDRNIPQAQNLSTGKGVKVAFLADGLDINNPDLLRQDGSRVVVDYQDFTGEGVNAPTGGGEAFGDASSVAAQGRQTYDLATFVNPAPRCRRTAPSASKVSRPAPTWSR